MAAYDSGNAAVRRRPAKESRISVSLNAFVTHYGYAAIAIGTFLEGETVLLIGAAFAQRHLLSLPLVIITAALGSFAGDQMYFHLGRRYGQRLLERFPRLAARAARVQTLLFRFRYPIIPALRFMYGFRVAGPFALGTSRVEPQIFFWLNALGAAVWSMAISGVGFGFAMVLRQPDVRHYEYLLGAAAVAVLAALVWWRRR